jgi:hypothetical protein
MSLEHRIARLEQAQERAQTWANYQMVAAEFGFDAHELIDEAETFFALPLDEQLSEVDTLAAHFTASELDHIKETLTRDYRQ